MADKTSVSKSKTYQEIGKFWDTHDASEFGEQDKIEFEVNIKSQRKYYSLDIELSSQIKQIARKRGISEETLLNLWVQEKVNQITALDKDKTAV